MLKMLRVSGEQTSVFLSIDAKTTYLRRGSCLLVSGDILPYV
jgi:hypothetical protein